MTRAAIERAAERARDFVLARGDALQCARARACFDPAARSDVERALADVAQPGAARAALACLDAIGIRDGAAVERAVALLAAAQAPDGSWSLDGGDEESRVAATVEVAGLLAKTHCVRRAVLDAAAAWLGARWTRERVEGAGAAALLVWAQLFANLAHEEADAGLQWCGRELERGWRSGAIGALDAARLFLRCDAQALPGARVTADDVALALVAAQAEDGGFVPMNPEPDERVEATLDALAALHRLAR